MSNLHKTDDQLYTEELNARLFADPELAKVNPLFLIELRTEVGIATAAAPGRKIDYAHLLPGTERQWFAHEDRLRDETNALVTIEAARARSMTLLGTLFWRGNLGAAVDMLCSGVADCGFDPLAGVDERGQRIGLIELMVLNQACHRHLPAWVKRFGLSEDEVKKVARKVEARIRIGGTDASQAAQSAAVVHAALAPWVAREVDARPRVLQMWASNLCALAACGAELGPLFRPIPDPTTPCRGAISVFLEMQLNNLATFGDDQFDTTVRSLHSLVNQGFPLNGALHEACCPAHPDLVRVLLSLGADPEGRDHPFYPGMTPGEALAALVAIVIELAIESDGAEERAVMTLLSSAIARREALRAIEAMSLTHDLREQPSCFL